MSAPATQADFSRFVAILGRGPGRSRALTRAEAYDAFTLILRDEVDPHQVGAFLMLLRFRGEDADEMTGIVEAIRAHSGLGRSQPPADTRGKDTIATAFGRTKVSLDWPSYGAGRTRGAPWFLLAALALAGVGHPVLMHGSNEFSDGIAVEHALAALSIAPSGDLSEAAEAIAASGFAYIPLSVLSPSLDRLLRLRRLFGLRSPVNTAARLLNPADAPAGVDGVFHPPYIDVHLGVAERMQRRRLLVLKGGGGEAERVPLKPATGHLWDRDTGRAEITLDPVPELATRDRSHDTPALVHAVWTGREAPPIAVATVIATIALGLLATGAAPSATQADADARALWHGRRAP
jgi:anthranilate phosphoribosyltransferase